MAEMIKRRKKMWWVLSEVGTSLGSGEAANWLETNMAIMEDHMGWG